MKKKKNYKNNFFDECEETVLSTLNEPVSARNKSQ